MSYSNLSKSFSVFTSSVTNIKPNGIKEALNTPEWRKVVHEKMSALEKNQTWRIEELPKGKSV